MLKNSDWSHRLYFQQGSAGIQVPGMTYQISHNAWFFPDVSFQGLRVSVVLPRIWSLPNREVFIINHSETECQNPSLNRMTMQLSPFLQYGKQILLFSPPCTTRVRHINHYLNVHIHRTSLWGYFNLNKLLPWNIGTTKKRYLKNKDAC